MSNKKVLKLSSANTLLNEVAENFINFKRSKKPPNNFNSDWRKLEKSLEKVRSLKRRGIIHGKN